ncbi:MAG: hypothetical protein AAF989_03815 [Planctomycetota bacterium]
MAPPSQQLPPEHVPPLEQKTGHHVLTQPAPMVLVPVQELGKFPSAPVQDPAPLQVSVPEQYSNMPADAGAAQARVSSKAMHIEIFLTLLII